MLLSVLDARVSSLSRTKLLYERPISFARISELSAELLVEL